MAVLRTCLLFLVFIISISSASAAQCHPGWTLHAKSCYTYGQSGVSWADAQEFCRTYGGKLAEIETSQEDVFIMNMVKNKQAHQVWIGGTDILNEGHWEWISTGSNIGPYTNWGQGQPDENGSGEDCMQYSNDFSYKWNDGRCDLSANFVCEAEPLG